MILRRKSILMSVGCVVITVGPANCASADTLFNGKQPVKIGHGRSNGNSIIWTNCSKQNPETFTRPPYSLDPADNCEMSPGTFGLECGTNACTVSDRSILQKYLPDSDIQNGEKVIFKLGEHSVHLEYKKNPSAATYSVVDIEH